MTGLHSALPFCTTSLEFVQSAVHEPELTYSAQYQHPGKVSASVLTRVGQGGAVASVRVGLLPMFAVDPRRCTAKGLELSLNARLAVMVEVDKARPYIDLHDSVLVPIGELVGFSAVAVGSWQKVSVAAGNDAETWFPVNHVGVDPGHDPAVGRQSWDRSYRPGLQFR